MVLYLILFDKREDVVNLYKIEKGIEVFREVLLKVRKEMKIKDLVFEYENLLEKIVYEEEGFIIINFDLVRVIVNVMLG